MLSLPDSYEMCRQIMMEKSRSFYYAFQSLPEERFMAVTALYAFNRYVDDIVDTPNRDTRNAEKELTHIEQQVHLFYKSMSTESKYPTLSLDWWPAFCDTIIRYLIPKEPLLKQIEGQRMDLTRQPIRSLDDLLNYSNLVAGSVGEMMLPLLLKEDSIITAAIQKAAISLGIAMQITNILRDIGEDYHVQQRIYLPLDMMESYRIPSNLIHNLSHSTGPIDVPQNFIDLWEHLAALSSERYEEIKYQLQHFHPTVKVPLLTAAYVYQGIETAVRDAAYNCFNQRNYTSPAQRQHYHEKAEQDILKLS